MDELDHLNEMPVFTYARIVHCAQFKAILAGLTPATAKEIIDSTLTVVKRQLDHFNIIYSSLTAGQTQGDAPGQIAIVYAIESSDKPLNKIDLASIFNNALRDDVDHDLGEKIVSPISLIVPPKVTS
jgi:hypothetical protein